MTPTKEWLKLWMENREQLSCQRDLTEYFEQEEVAGCPVRSVRVGLCPVPSGSLVAFDPCAAADCPPQPYLVTAPELSRQSGVPKGTIEDIEARGDCRISTAFALCMAMNITLDEIYEPDPKAE